MDSQQEHLPIDISFPKKEFEKHLALNGNRRIIFSGPFGSGKTYFLREFFSDEEKYVPIRLAPVNYSVAQNEDIFELIKFDILFQLLEKNLFPEDAGVSKTFILRHLSLLDLQKGITGILEKADKAGKNILPIFTELQSVLQGTATPRVSLDSPEGLNELNGLLIKITRNRGGIYEQNVLTQLLYYLISKVGSDNKETVLLIDDLDRMDPEHIFRILNVFAAHFDIDSAENKFGFDRVILVCDLENVRKIFSSRYGQNADFSGYIDKFYSQEVFSFDNSKAVKDVISKVLCSMNLVPEKLSNFFPFNNVNSNSHRFVLFVLMAFIQVNATNLRSIQRARRKSFHIETKEMKGYLGTHQFTLIWILELIRMIVGDGISLLDGIQKCASAKIGNEIFAGKGDSHKDKLGEMLPIFTIRNDFKINEKYLYHLDVSGITFHYHLKSVGPRMETYWAEVVKMTDKEDKEVFNPRIDFFALLLKAAKEIQLIGFLK